MAAGRIVQPEKQAAANGQAAFSRTTAIYCRGEQLMDGRRKSLQVAVGEQIRLQRLNRWLSVAELARLIDVSEEELEAYERGEQRIPSSRLWDLAEAFGVPLSSFFNTFRPG